MPHETRATTAAKIRRINWTVTAGSVMASILVLFSGGCRSGDFFSKLPQGAMIGGDADALVRALSRLERLELAPLGRDARELRERIAACKAFSGSSADGEIGALMRSIRCAEVEALPEALKQIRGDADFAVLLPIGDAGRVAGAARVAADGSLSLDARFQLDANSNAGKLLLPASELPGAPTLNGDDVLLHGRFRPEGGLNIAALVPQDSQASDLFRMKSELFAGAVLDGTLEFAVYLPEAGRQIPPLALSVGFRFKRAAIAAMDQFVSDLRETWPVTPVPLTLGEHSGACLDNLKILPEFAPCYVATDEALVIGWDKASVSRSLSKTKTAALDERGGLFVFLERFSAADEMLRATLPKPPAAFKFDYAWDRLIARTSVREGEYRLQIELEAKGDS
ncbi:MAG: hypothetical protein GY725_08400 [bacterium]|nr:hypothetical protein [bacterium]